MCSQNIEKNKKINVYKGIRGVVQFLEAPQMKNGNPLLAIVEGFLLRYFPHHFPAIAKNRHIHNFMVKI